MNAHFLEVARLMARIARNVFADEVFALKGGTAINLFARDLPRLSVDLDLVFVDHTLPRDQALAAIGSALQVVIEVNEIMRGTLLPVQLRPLQPNAREILGVDLELPVLAESEVYAGKLVAAMDRQHPRDLFDVHHLFAAGGITPEMQRCFVAYLASHNRPVHEILAPKLKDISATLEGAFRGMARDAVDLKTLLVARERLISEVPKSLSSAERQFLLSLAAAEPEWRLLGFPNLGEMPGPRWKLQNLQTLAKKNPVKFRSQQTKLAELIGG
jgi:hypothetical protein